MTRSQWLTALLALVIAGVLVWAALTPQPREHHRRATPQQAERLLLRDSRKLTTPFTEAHCARTEDDHHFFCSVADAKDLHVAVNVELPPDGPPIIRRH